jgi:hypothetical protein
MTPDTLQLHLSGRINGYRMRKNFHKATFANKKSVKLFEHKQHFYKNFPNTIKSLTGYILSYPGRQSSYRVQFSLLRIQTISPDTIQKVSPDTFLATPDTEIFTGHNKNRIQYSKNLPPADLDTMEGSTPCPFLFLWF